MGFPTIRTFKKCYLIIYVYYFTYLYIHRLNVCTMFMDKTPINGESLNKQACFRFNPVPIVYCLYYCIYVYVNIWKWVPSIHGGPLEANFITLKGSPLWERPNRISRNWAWVPFGTHVAHLGRVIKCTTPEASIIALLARPWLKH